MRALFLFYLLAVCQSMAVRRHDTELAESPRLVAGWLLGKLGAACFEIVVNLVNIRNESVTEVRMIARFVCPQRISTFAEHYLEDPERKKLPARCGKIAVEPEFFNKILARNREVLDRKNVPRMYNFVR